MPDGPATSLFADIAGFTALTEAHGDEADRAGGSDAIARGGDYFGANVNLAARVSSAAAGGEVLVTGRTAALVRIARASFSSPGVVGACERQRAGRSLRRAEGW